MRIAALVLALAAGTGPLAAAEIKANSRVDAVTVFPQGAEVRRVARIRIDAGDHVAIFSDLPAQAQPGSIRVEGKATGPLEIGTVDTRRVSVPRGDPQAAATARRRLEEEIEKLRDERARIEAERQAAEAQRTFVTNLVQLPGRPQPSPAGSAPAREDWAQILGLIAKEMAPIQRAILDAQVRVREVDRRIADAEGRLKAEGPAMVERTEVKVLLAARGPIDADLTVSYMVAEAGWTPSYDARLASGGKSAVPKLAIARRGTITQRTAEAWENVAVALSTARPAAGTAAPELRPITIDFPPERPIAAAAPPPAPLARSIPSGGARQQTAEATVSRDEPAEERMTADAVSTQQAQVEAGAFQAVYSILGRQTVLNTGESKRVHIDEIEAETQLTARTAPRIDERAFLYAKFTTPRATPWLPGQVSLFRDTTFVGQGRLPLLAPGQEHELGFGADDRVRVRASSIEEKRGETGIIAASRTDLRTWRLTVRNLHERPIQLVLQDQTPVPNNQDIKVELIAKPMPAKRDLNDRRGVLQWEDRLNPDEEKAYEFGYRVSWPATKSIVYGR